MRLGALRSRAVEFGENRKPKTIVALTPVKVSRQRAMGSGSGGVRSIDVDSSLCCFVRVSEIPKCQVATIGRTDANTIVGIVWHAESSRMDSRLTLRLSPCVSRLVSCLEQPFFPALAISPALIVWPNSSAQP